MDEFDIFASQSSAMEEKDLFDLGNTTAPITTTATIITDLKEKLPDEDVHSNSIHSDFDLFSPLSNGVENMPSFLDEQVLSPLQAINQKRELEIAAKDAEEHRKMNELRQQAKQDLERWYNEREKQIDRKREASQTTERDSQAKLLEKSTKQTCDWSKVIQLLDFTEEKQFSRSKRDVTRMKSVIFSAKRFHETKKLANGSEN